MIRPQRKRFDCCCCIATLFTLVAIKNKQLLLLLSLPINNLETDHKENTPPIPLLLYDVITGTDHKENSLTVVA
jgi:hypothetical protein